MIYALHEMGMPIRFISADAVNGLLHNTLQVENVIWEQSRTLAKYGNNFELLRYTNEGVVGQDFISPALVRRFEL